MRRFALASVLVAPFLAACASHPSGPDEGDDDGLPVPPAGWAIRVDLSALDRFAPPDAATWTIAGKATASEGLAGVDVAGASANVTGDGSFTADAPIMPGLTTVPIVARDRAMHERRADRSILSARYLPAGDHNPVGASMVLTSAVVQAMAAGLAGQAGDIDVAAEIEARDVLSQDDRCVTWPVSASQGQVAVRLVLEGSDLWLNIRVPSLYVSFAGRCQGLIATIPIAGEMGGTLDVWTKLTARAPAAGAACVTAFAHTTPEVQVNGWFFDVWGTSGPLQGWIVQLFSGSKSAEAREQLRTEVGAKAHTMLATRLQHVSVFDRTSSLDLLGRPLTMHLCVGALERSGSRLIARVAASASGGGDRVAPGAPQLDGPAPAPAAGELLLDGNLVAQLLFAAWRDGGLVKPGVEQVDAELLTLVAPDLIGKYPTGTMATVSLDGELPPLVTATPGGAGDLKVVIGDLMLDIAVGDDHLFKIGAVLTLDLDLIAMDGKLVPTVVGSAATAVVLDEMYDANDTLLADVISARVADTASTLLAGAALSLPELPGLGAPVDVTADAGGRFLHVRLQ